MTQAKKKKTVARLIIECLQAEGVEYIFGLPGEENMRIMLETVGTGIRFIVVRHEQGASFMADIYGRLTGKAGVCMATLGPGAINLLLGVADATTDSTPLVAITAQVGLDRIYKESHQIVDLENLFKPVTKWSSTITTAASAPEMIRKAFDLAENERPGAVFLCLPEDIESAPAKQYKPLPCQPRYRSAPLPAYVDEAARLIGKAKNPVILAGFGVARAHASAALRRFAEHMKIPVATTYMAKGVLQDGHPLLLGVIGFMRHDYQNFAFEEADLLICLGYEFQEFSPVKINPEGRKPVIHIHDIAQEVDRNYPIAVALQADIAAALDAFCGKLEPKSARPSMKEARIIRLHRNELKKGESNARFPVKPQRMINDIRKAMGEADIVLCDTGAHKMWMARLYPTYQPLTCLISNGLSTMGWTLPGAVGAKLARPEAKVLVVTGDGSFMMNSQEIETALREKIHFVILIWEDNSYGLIKWKMDLEFGHHDLVDFDNPDFVAYARSFGAKAYRIRQTADLLPTLKKALADDTVSVIVCPVDYSENMKLIKKLGDVDRSF